MDLIGPLKFEPNSASNRPRVERRSAKEGVSCGFLFAKGVA
jgi:hypothetical protein